MSGECPHPTGPIQEYPIPDCKPKYFFARQVLFGELDHDDAEWFSGCTGVHFSARARRDGTQTAPYFQPLWYYPMRRRGRRPLDPDIRYPGNGGQSE